MSVDPLFQLEDLANLSKYKMAGKIVSKVLDALVNICVSGTNVYDMCQNGDKMMLDELDKVYKDVAKGISFPTCGRINNVAGFYAPKVKVVKDTIKNGDLVKIELGAHIDGYPAFVCYTVVIGTIKKDDGRANVLKAISEASKEILGIMKPGYTNTDVIKIMDITEIVQEVI